MNIRYARRLVVGLCAATFSILGIACNGLTGVLAPSSIAGLPAGASSLLGTWTSSGGAASSTACSNFTWAITSQTATNATGTISALCLGTIPLNATASAQLNGTTLDLVITGTGTLPGPVACNFQISGTASLDGDTIRIPYSGTTCLGPVTGTEVLRKSPPPAPAPLPVPDPAPAPPAPPPPPPAVPTPEPWEACASLVWDKPHLVECVHDAINPGGSLSRAFEVTKVVAWLSRGEGMGLLLKDGGENIIAWQGHWFSVSRVCYPDGHIFKVVSDAGEGGTNGVSWADNGYVDPKFYLAPIDPKSGG